MLRGKVIATRMLTPSVKWMRIESVSTPHPSFKAGQWADVFIPGTKLVGGYSMCSTPGQLEASRTFDLAVKRSDWPPTLWMINDCVIGTELDMKFGGEVFYDTSQRADSVLGKKILLLIAGGVGINPLYSILLSSLEWKASNCHIELYYSASAQQELQFKEEIDELAESNEKLDVKYFVTRAGDNVTDDITARRINKSDFQHLQGRQAEAFLCGPDNFMESVENYLIASGVDKSQIHYEKWW